MPIFLFIFLLHMTGILGEDIDTQTIQLINTSQREYSLLLLLILLYSQTITDMN